MYFTDRGIEELVEPVVEELRAEDPAGYVERATASMAEEVNAMLAMKARATFEDEERSTWDC